MAFSILYERGLSRWGIVVISRSNTFVQRDLPQIWKAPTYPPHSHEFLLGLLEKFEGFSHSYIFSLSLSLSLSLCVCVVCVVCIVITYNSFALPLLSHSCLSFTRQERTTKRKGFGSLSSSFKTTGIKKDMVGFSFVLFPFVCLFVSFSFSVSLYFRPKYTKKPNEAQERQVIPVCSFPLSFSLSLCECDCGPSSCLTSFFFRLCAYL